MPVSSSVCFPLKPNSKQKRKTPFASYCLSSKLSNFSKKSSPPTEQPKNLYCRRLSLHLSLKFREEHRIFSSIKTVTA